MNELRRLANYLEMYQDEQDELMGTHQPIVLTAAILAAMIRKLEANDQEDLAKRGR